MVVIEVNSLVIVIYVASDLLSDLKSMPIDFKITFQTVKLSFDNKFAWLGKSFVLVLIFSLSARYVSSLLTRKLYLSKFLFFHKRN